MNIHQQSYKNKVITAKEAAAMVKTGDNIYYSEFTLFPHSLDLALSKRIMDGELENLKLSVVCLIKVPEVIKADPEQKRVTTSDWHFSAVSRRLGEQGLISYVPMTYHQGPHIIRKYIDYDVAFISAAPMGKNGNFNIGISNSMSSAAISKSKKIIVEINKNIPRCLGGNQEFIHVSKVDHIIEGEHPALAETSMKQASDEDKKIASYIINEIREGCCLQLGIGGLPNLIGGIIGEMGIPDLGVHTEMMVDSFADLYEKGLVSGAKKNTDKGKMTYTFAMGTKRLYDFLNNNPACASYPVDYINDAKIISQNDNVVAINNALEIDLTGQVCSESSGHKQISGTGGQLDYIYGAFLSRGGKGIIAMKSTFNDKDGQLKSTIRPVLSQGAIVTLPRSIVQYVVSENGIVQLKGKNTKERAEALISISHPDFREDMIKEADKMGLWGKRGHSF
ncbi:acetyl-CoA hydrolase/transferase family protein [Desulforegula conservatrix]|uniref:acetyl-CoA hydrolase/transferase family protein n=1 Tax=Desulforegula conservatrix TaxID=153026 RepID=UPI000424F0BF|nr:acetyl-CoA hydrolase/transferase C-terminal domain-containing protein [Desulforegula conservatrix]